MVQSTFNVADPRSASATPLHSSPADGRHSFYSPSGAAAVRYSIFHSLFHYIHILGGLIGGTFSNTASHGTDQLMVQRSLVACNQRDSGDWASARPYMPPHLLRSLTLFWPGRRRGHGLLSSGSSRHTLRCALTMFSPDSSWTTCRMESPVC